MNRILHLFIVLCFAAIAKTSVLLAQPCNLCGSTNAEWISGFTLNGSSLLLGPPGPGIGGCADPTLFDGYFVIFKKGATHTLSLTPGFSNAPQSEFWKCWIDLNHDGDFDDVGDLVFASNSGSSGTVNGTFFIPLTVEEGPAQMRVAMRRGSPPPDCGNYSNGQTLTYHSVYIDECDLSFTSACAREYIKQVNVNTINNASGCSSTGYQDFTNITTTLDAGNAYQVQLTPGFFNAGQHPERWLIWIDYNKDYDFEDPGEQVFDSGAAGSTSTIFGNINIPAGTPTVTTRMRIKMIPTDTGGGSLDPCDPIPGLWFGPDAYGEAEDYTVKIKGFSLEVQNDSPENLVKNVLFGGNCFDVANVSFSGQGDQIGFFSNGLTNIGFNNGVILASGSISVAAGPNNSDGASGGFGIGTPDSDLATLASGALFDMANIEFDFTPTQTPFTFEFVFASEEYCEYVNTQFNDVFGFFISGPGIQGTQNLAVIPSTNTPVSINTVNHLVNSGLYTHNTPASGNNCGFIPPATGPAVNELQYDGFTRKMVAVANVIPCSTYHIKLKVADVGDGVWDSAVFIKGGSLDGGGNASIDWVVNGQTGVDEITEGCGTAALLLDRLGSSAVLPLPVSFSISGTATNGADYGPISTTYIIPSGIDQLTVPVNIVNDFIPEGAETVSLTLNNACSCLNPQKTLTILDYKSLIVKADSVLIPGPGVATINVTIQGGAAPYTYIWNTGESAQSINPYVTTPTAYSVTVTDACGNTATAIGLATFNQPDWEVVPTSRNHTIIIPNTLTSDIFGGSLQHGDVIGVFYDSAATGTLKCGGLISWQGQNTTIIAYGNDATAPAHNGFTSGELFKVKVWRSGTGEIFPGTAQYAPVGWLGGLITHTNAFADDGISMLTSFVAGATQAIPLKVGWNLISSYIVPTNPGMPAIFAPVASNVDIVKECDGSSYIPLLMINGIGDWNVKTGYQVKANAKDTLIMMGLQVMPEDVPISINAGWNCIAYLRDNPRNVATVFSTIQGNIELVKNNEGKIYSPQFGINTIGNMLPGQGYKVKASTNTTLLYSSNFGGTTTDGRDQNTDATLSHFILNYQLNTGNNATLFLPRSVAENTLLPGDEIGIFNPEGLLCGAAIYTGKHVAITVWGDDASTAGIKEGIQPGDAYLIKIWNKADQDEYSVLTSLESGQNAYAPDAVEMITQWEVVSDTKDLAAAGIQSLYLFPNPTAGDLNIDLSSNTAGTMTVSIYSSEGVQLLSGQDMAYVAGKTIQPLDTRSQLPSGVYWIKFQFEKGIIYRQVVLLD